MTKILFVFLTFIYLNSFSYAYEYQLKSGWQLLGAMEDISLESLDNSCIEHIWTYEDNQWKLYTTSSSSHSHTLIETIKEGNGFWLSANSECTFSSNSIIETLTYKIVDTNQSKCYDSSNGSEITCTSLGYDADYLKNAPSYSLNNNGTIVTDNITTLMWTQTSDIDNDGLSTDSDDKLSYDEAVSYCSNLSLEGYNDWRLPDIKTLYSLMQFSGEDPSGYTGTDTSGLKTFLDTTYAQAFGDQINGERIIDGQYATSTKYVSTTMNGDETMFGVNFVDGRIKGYPTSMRGSDKTFYTLCVRGNETYGQNNFVDNQDDTISDNATGLMWQKNDFISLNFDEAVNTCENLNLAGNTDWRLPNIKELQSIVDYSKSPDTTSSAAINDIFNSTAITNEEGETDWGYYWSSTTHANSNGYGDSAAYISFGRALGYTQSAVLDVHGAGSQRSNNKEDLQVSGSSSVSGANGTFEYHGPQGDILRVDNMVRCVRDID